MAGPIEKVMVLRCARRAGAPALCERLWCTRYRRFWAVRRFDYPWRD